METNALFAGQYADLKEYGPEAVAQLTAWVKEPPRDVQADTFRAACIRALRDLVPAAQATDSLRDTMRATLEKAQQTRNQNVYLTAVCALHQFGDKAPFEATKAEVEKNLQSDQEPVKLAALATLADLHYQLREYETAANYYKDLIALIEKSPSPPPNLPTTIYNAACSLSLANKLDEAFAMLDKALQTGVKQSALSKAMIDSDHDMNNLRADPRFTKLMEQYFGPKKDAGK
jgi:tetratricopeptide (TPR) repeat protein